MSNEKPEKTKLERILVEDREIIAGMRRPGETFGQVITRILAFYLEHQGEEPVTPAQVQMSLFSEPVTTVNTDQIRDIVKDAVKEEINEIKKELDQRKEISIPVNAVNTVNARAEETSIPDKSQEPVTPELPMESDVPRMIKLSDEMKKKLSDRVAELKAMNMTDDSIAVKADIRSRSGKISPQKVSDLLNLKTKNLPSDQIYRLLNLKP